MPRVVLRQGFGEERDQNWVDMPYFVFKVFPNKRLEFVESAEKYRDAKRHAREMRTQLGPDDDYTVNLIFAQNSDEAERLLKEKREPRPLGEDA